MKKLLASVLILALVGALAAGGAFFWLERASYASRPAGEGDAAKVIFTVPRGVTARKVGQLLEEQGLIESRQLWRYHLWRRGNFAATAGRFELQKGLSVAEVARRLEGPALPEDQPFVIVEGWRIRDTDAALAAQGLITAGTYAAAASRSDGFTAPFPLPVGSLEGYLYPETYRIPKEGFDVAALVQRQLETFVERVYLPHRAEVEKGKRPLSELVILASMLEREEPVPEQRPLVAGIMWRRIDMGIPLGVDATSRYELEVWNDRQAFLKRLRDHADLYNTRLRKGLPPTPIGSPTEASFVAALRPVKSEYLYYLHDAERKLHPSRNAAEHEALRKKYNVY